MDALKPAIDALHAEGRLRVWSLVITVFGDTVQHRGGQITTHRLQQLLGRIGVESGALRTALSRLSRDGWVTGERQGKRSTYRLTPSGLAQFSDATHRIYAPPRSAPVTDWALSFGTGLRGLPLGGGTLRPADQAETGTPDFSITGQITTLSQTQRAALLSDAHRAALTALIHDLDCLARTPPDPLTAIAARTLLIHRWRRLVLRYPEVPAELLPPGLGPLSPRARVSALYHTLTPTAEGWCDSFDAAMPAMPAAAPGFARRFRPA